MHRHDNLFVADGSLHVTNGGFNPVLTIIALAFRTADHVARALTQDAGPRHWSHPTTSASAMVRTNPSMNSSSTNGTWA